MIKVENIDVWGFEHAIRGMRNPMNSWNKSDSEWVDYDICPKFFVLGNNDLDLMEPQYLHLYMLSFLNSAFFFSRLRFL